MADKKPIKATYSGTDTNGLAEFVAADTIGVADGGTGLTTVATSNLLTGNGASALSAEANLTFDGTHLNVNTGAYKTTGSTSTYHVFSQFFDSGKGNLQTGAGTAGAYVATDGWDLNFATNGLGSAGTEPANIRMKITSAGLVGIGLTPTKPFHVRTASDFNFGVQNTSSSVYVSAVNNANNALVPMTLAASTLTIPGSNVHIQTASGSQTAHANADELLIENSANSGITIVSGTGSTGNIYFGDSGNPAIGQFAYNHSNNSMIFTTNDGGARLIIDSSGDFTGSSSADISDARLKENVVELTGCLAQVNALRGVSYNFLPEANKNDDLRYGLLAQEVEAVIPAIVWDKSIHDIEAVEGVEAADAVLYVEGDEIPEGENIGDVKTPAVEAVEAVEAASFKSLHYTGLIPVFIEAIKELTARITALESA